MDDVDAWGGVPTELAAPAGPWQDLLYAIEWVAPDEAMLVDNATTPLSKNTARQRDNTTTAPPFEYDRGNSGGSRALEEVTTPNVVGNPRFAPR